MITKNPISDPTPYAWTSEEFQRLGEMGIFGDQRVELIEGQVLIMSPMGTPHILGIMLLTNELPKIVGDRYTVLVQGPLTLSGKSQPMPDGAILRGTPRDYQNCPPKDALLVIEVSESTLNFDRTDKARIYAEANIPEYWIINLIDRQIEVFRDPRPETGYAAKSIAKAGEWLRLVAAPEIAIDAGAILP